MYKHSEVPEEDIDKVIYIEVINDEPGYALPSFEKGAITWVTKENYITSSGLLIHPEHNLYGINFKGKDFKIISKPHKKIEMSFKKGDKVRIKKDSKYYGTQDEKKDGTKRTFTIDSLGDDGVRCSSDDGYENGYTKGDLELIASKEVIMNEKGVVITEVESMGKMVDVLEKVYDNLELRKSIVPLFIGDPGLGKTKIIEQFAKKKGARLVELITSQMSPFEISGIAMPDKDTKKMTYYNFDKIESLKSGDILFFDELLNGNPIVLNACLTILEQRTLISGKKLPNVMIIAAANPQGVVPLTPQIKERFLWFNVDFSPNMWKGYMKNKYKMPEEVSSKLCELIVDEEFTNNNFYTPRSIDKAVAMMAKNCPTPYEDVLTPILSTMISNGYKKRRIRINKTEYLNPGESMLWLDFLKKSKA